eukprot:444863_1
MGNSPQGSSAARSVWVQFKNETAYTIKETSYGLDHGIWTTSSPSKIPPNSTKSWQSESNGLWTGTEGYCRYEINGKTFRIRWNNPYAGSNDYYCSSPEGFTVSYRGGSGDNADVYFKIVKKKLTLTISQMPSIPQQLLNLYVALYYNRDNNLTTKVNAYELKEEAKDEVEFILKRKEDVAYTSLEAPNSVTLNYKNMYKNQDYTILFGTKGSNVHIAMSLVTYQNPYGYSSTYHFGLL